MKKTLVLMIVTFFLTVFIGQYYVVFANDNTGNIDTEEFTRIRGSYDDYLAQYEMVTPSIDPIRIKASDYLNEKTTAEVKVIDKLDGTSNVLHVPESGMVTWKVDVPETGFYQLFIRYYPVEGKGSAIERRVYVNDVMPFDGAGRIILPRLWKNAREVQHDINGNDMKPSQIEAPRWRQMYLQDELGYVQEPYLFYFKKGENTLTFESIKEPIAIDFIEIHSYEPLPSYEKVLEGYQEKGYQEVSDAIIKIQAEDATEKSSPTLYPITDRSSSYTEPFHYSKIRLNSIGGERWRINGDFITWTVHVPKSGLYKISFRAKQNFVRGTFVNRELWINDQIPFKEAQYLQFKYDNHWQMVTLGNGKEDFLFYFEEGENTITLVSSLGDFGSLIEQVQQAILNLNTLYREILRYTGPQPDRYRDYQLNLRIPDMLERFEQEADRLQGVVDEMVSVTGQRSDQTAIINKVIIQLNDFVKKPREVHQRLKEFKDNISALGNWIQTVSEQPLTLDYLLVHSADVKLPKAKEGFFGRIWHQIRLFFTTFFTDYSSIGLTSSVETKETIEVWLPVPAKSRDHANALRQLIDESFTPETGIGVDLKLVKGEVLLPATLTGQGPDVALSLSESLPVNYALRGAVYDLSQFDDFDEVIKRFHESAMIPYELEGGYYGLPEEQHFLMMFYRTDILEDLGIEVPNTWDDVIDIIPDLQKHHLEFYMPVGSATVTTAEVNRVFSSILYQHNGRFYNEQETATALVEEEALSAFETWTRYYIDYGFSVEANFVNRFRSGEMPIGIAPYNIYNTLSVFAPEIKGDWNFTSIPGTIQRDQDGNILYDDLGQPIINRDSAGTTLGMIILEQSEHKEAAWEFLKWFTSTETQVRYGRELEGVLGPGARYPTANMEALEQLPWTAEEYEKLSEQWQYVRGIPQIPGSYILARNVINAFYESYNSGGNPREALLDYAVYIDEEIRRKRAEFGLD